MISEIGRLAVEFGAASIRIPVRVTGRNLPVRQFLESIDGQHLLQESDQLHILTPEVAATYCFRPDDHAEFAEHGTETHISSIRQVASMAQSGLRPQRFSHPPRRSRRRF